jgi:ribosomal protein S18 acetylase RimI-like enzyme
MPSFSIQPIDESRREWITRLLVQRWGSTIIVSRGVVHQGDHLPGYSATLEGSLVGLVTFHVSGEECEIVTLDSTFEGIGIGSALIQSVRQAAIEAGCRRLWLITTNDNLPALRFYQKRGFHLIAIYPDALEGSRQLKPEIPVVGLDGIPLRDEIELEILL